MKRQILIACALVSGLAAGCPAGPESDEAACRRVMNHLLSCFFSGDPPAEVLAGLNEQASQLCENLPQRSECNWSEYADCMTMVPCDDTSTSPGDACEDIIIEFNNNACSPEAPAP